MADIHHRLKKATYLRGLSGTDFVTAAGRIIGDLNYVHPFREGNGRTQLYYLNQLAKHAGHPIDLVRLDPQRWIGASRAAHNGNYGPMADEIGRLVPDLPTTPS
jgi:cell filamentation protein